jgi:integrase
MANSQKPLGFSKTVGAGLAVPVTAGWRDSGGRPRLRPEGRALSGELIPVDRMASRVPLDRLVRDWLLDLRLQGRSPQTLTWYRQKLRWYLDNGGVSHLEDLTARELKGLLLALQERGLAENTIHGYFEVFKAFANWADREGMPVDPALLRVRAPKVAQKEMETYTAEQMNRVMAAAAPGWPRLAVQVLLGTGMRVGELCALTLTDFEDDEDVAFLKVQRGKGGKFRRVPVSQRLRRELSRYINRSRPEGDTAQLLLRSDGRPVTVGTVTDLCQRLRRQLGFPIHAHKFRHTFATEYLRAGGEIERLRRILGHTTYVMVMRYVHLDRGDLGRDFEQRAPF